MKKKIGSAEDKVKELDCIIKSIRRKMKKHPSGNLTEKIHQFSDQQVKELKRGIKELESFIDLQHEDNGKEEI